MMHRAKIKRGTQSVDKIYAKDVWWKGGEESIHLNAQKCMFSEDSAQLGRFFYADRKSERLEPHASHTVAVLLEQQMNGLDYLEPPG